MIFYPRKARKARKYSYSQVGRNKLIRATARISVSGKHLSLPETPPRATRLDGLIPAYFAKNADLSKILGTTFLIFFVLFVPFVEKLLF
jgi:hypothetical protein